MLLSETNADLSALQKHGANTNREGSPDAFEVMRSIGYTLRLNKKIVAPCGYHTAGNSACMFPPPILHSNAFFFVDSNDRYAFDYVFDATATQRAVYENTTKFLIQVNNE